MHPVRPVLHSMNPAAFHLIVLARLHSTKLAQTTPLQGLINRYPWTNPYTTWVSYPPRILYYVWSELAFPKCLLGELEMHGMTHGACQEEDQDQPYWYGGHSPVVTYRMETIERDSGSYWNRFYQLHMKR